MILVTAATGQVGGAALNALVAGGAEVRALVRNPSGFAAPEGVEVVKGSFDDDTSLAEVRHIVKLSAIGASSASPVGSLMREHDEVDEEARKGPADWTLLKAHLYMQNLLRAADAVQREAGSRLRWDATVFRSSTPAMSAPPQLLFSAIPPPTPARNTC